MIALWVVVYLAIGAVFAFEAYKHDWNETTPHYQQPGHLSWLLAWPWNGGYKWFPVFGAWLDNAGEDVRNWVNDLFDRLIDYEWRQDGKEDESTEGS